MPSMNYVCKLKLLDEWPTTLILLLYSTFLSFLNCFRLHLLNEF